MNSFADWFAQGVLMMVAAVLAGRATGHTQSHTFKKFSDHDTSKTTSSEFLGQAVLGRCVPRSMEKMMRLPALSAISALTLGACLYVGSVAAQAADYGYEGYDEPETVVTRRTVVEQRVIRPQRIVREEIIERPPVYAPRRVVREVVEERPVIYRPRPVVREVFVEPDRRFYDHRPYGPRPVGFRRRGPDFDPYD